MEYVAKYANNYLQYMEQYHIHSLLAKYLDVSGHTDEEIAEFMELPYCHIPPREIMEPIAQRLYQALRQKERVFVFGDYDMDGIAATTQMVMILRKMGFDRNQHGYYIPDRFQEGYGLNVSKVQLAYEKGYRLIVTVDNGVKAQEALSLAHALGMDVLILDHHTMDESVSCCALLHSSDFPYGMQNLCGSGLVLQLAKYLELDLREFYPLAMCATIADMMEFDGENRWIVKEGLRLLRQNQHPRLASLYKGNITTITETEVAYYINPLCNAVGRLPEYEKTYQLVRYLLGDFNPTQQAQFIKKMDQINEIRKEKTKQHLSLIESMEHHERFMVFAHEQFHPGIVGLVANRLSHAYHRPVMVVSIENGVCHGSVRGVKSFHLMDCLNSIKDWFVAFGGHKMAAGVTFDATNLPQIQDYLQNYIFEQKEEQTICVAVDAQDMSKEAMDEFFAYAPYGKGWEQPFWYYHHAEIDEVRMLKVENWIKVQTPTLSGVWFSDGHSFREYLNKKQLHLIGTIDHNYFRGVHSYQMKLESIEF